MAIAVSNNPDRSRYEVLVDGKVAGFARYQRTGDVINFYHTEVDPAFEGQGLGSKLASGALDDVRASGVRAIATCPFISAYIKRHPEYAELLATS
jgi:predicted GNAT family acetyltransferase